MAHAGRPRGHLHVRKPDAVLAPVLAAAPGDQASPRVAAVLDRDEHQGLPDDMDVRGQRDGGRDGTVQRSELLVIIAGIAEEPDKEAFTVQHLAARVSHRRHEVSADLLAAAPSADMPGPLHGGLTVGKSVGEPECRTQSPPHSGMTLDDSRAPQRAAGSDSRLDRGGTWLGPPVRGPGPLEPTRFRTLLS